MILAIIYNREVETAHLFFKLSLTCVFCVFLCLFFLISLPEPPDSQGELTVYQYSGVRPSIRPSSIVVVRLPSVDHFQRSSPKPLLNNYSQITCGPPLEGGRHLYKLSRSHDQDCRHAHEWKTLLKIFFSRTKGFMILKLGKQHRD